MLYTNDDGSISLTRGDTARLTVDIENELTSEKYIINEQDVLTLSIKKSIKDDTYLVQKVITGSNMFHIEPEDTSDLAFGKYKYDVQLTTSDGDVFTVIEPNTFEILTEVTD